MRRWISGILILVVLFSGFLSPMMAKAATADTYPITGYVNADKVNIRTGAGTTYAVAYKLNTNDSVTIHQQVTADGLKWGQLTDGNWICLDYVTLIWNGVVNADKVNVRTGAGKSYSVAYRLNTGDAVTIYQQVTAGGLKWGQLADGNWICLDYVTFTEPDVEEPAEPETPTEPEEPTEPETPTEPEEPTEPETPEVSEFPKEGIVNGTDVRVRTGAGTSYSVAYKLNTGAKVSIQQQVTAGGLEWGQLADGNWICLTYVNFQGDTGNTTKPETSGVLTSSQAFVDILKSR